jgi:hypothetical protein
MDVKYSPEVRQWADGLQLLEQASTNLADMVGARESNPLKAEWNSVQDRQGRTLYRLTIRDSTDEVSTDFAPDELRNSLHMRVRLPRLWGDLLQLRNDRQHEKVRIISGLIAKAAEGH